MAAPSHRPYLMRRRDYLFHWPYWRKRSYPLLTRYLIRPSIDFRNLPLVAVTGTSGKTSVTLLVNRILRDAGYRTGCACSEGVMVNGRWVEHGDESGAKGLWRASRSLGLNALVAETARGGILHNGLGFSTCDVSVVTNVDDDHIGLNGVNSVEQMAEVKSILPRHTRPSGATVLNLDQPLVYEMARRSPARAIFFSLEEPPESVADSFFLHSGTIFRKRGPTRESVLSANRIFLSHGGAVTYQIANAMTAMAVIEALQAKLPVSRSSLEQSLAEFGRESSDLPHRLQLFRYQGVDVLLTATKNPANYQTEVPLIRRLIRAHAYRRVICVVSEVGNRPEKCYRDVARAAATVADAVVCLAPQEKYRRGRAGDEIVRLLSAEVPPEKLVRPRDASLGGVFAHFPPRATEPTLFVAFASGFYTGIVEDILSRGEQLPLRFDP